MSLTALLIISTNAHAGEEIRLDDVTLEDLMNIEVSSASKQNQKVFEAPAIVSVITREQFNDYGYFTLNDAVSHEAGFFPSQDYDRTTIGSRGLFEGWNNNHLLLLMDGVPFNDPMYGSAYTWDNTPTFMIKSVEVIRGPGSALYGTNATNGVLAVNTLSGSDMKGKTEAQLRVGTHNEHRESVYTGNEVGNFNYFLGYSSENTQGNEYDSVDNRVKDGNTGRFLVRDNRTDQYMMFKLEGEHELKHLSLQVHDQQWTYQTGHGWLFDIPDFQDAMKEHRDVAVLSYKPDFNEGLHSEFTAKYEHKEIDWFTRYAPNGAILPGLNTTSGTAQPYSNGISEYVDTTHDNYFARAQLTWDLPSKSNFLTGLESSTFVYNGDKSHYANVDLTSADYHQTSGGWMNAPGILGLVKGKPITNIGGYAQYMTGEALGRQLQMTAGLRYDIEQVNYDRAVAGLGTGTGSRTFKQFSPRLAGVFEISRQLSLKILAGKAFRAPAPSELAGTNTFALANNIANLQPETVLTTEAGVDWHPNEGFVWKANVFRTESKDQIGYSGATNLSTNIYSATTIGAESEVSYVEGRWKNFANISWAARVGEGISDNTVAGENNSVTWAPSLTGNAGTSYGFTSKVKGTLLASYLGKVKRRDTDMLIAANAADRPMAVPEFYILDAAALWQVVKGGELSFYVKNLFDRQGYLIKNRDYPFDYQMDRRTIYASYTQSF
jgi:iron complex outermembrane receptor protein